MHKYRLGKNWLDCREEPGTYNRPEAECEPTVCSFSKKKGNSTVGCINRNATCKSREVILLPNIELVRSHLEYCIHFWEENLNEKCRQIRNNPIESNKNDQRLSKPDLQKKVWIIQFGEEKGVVEGQCWYMMTVFKYPKDGGRLVCDCQRQEAN